MGRIAEALKRAEQERARAVEVASADLRAERPDSGRVEFATGEVLGTMPSVSPPSGDAAGEGALVAPGSNGGHGSDPCVIHKEGLDESLVPFLEPSSLIAEQYRALRTRLLSQNPHYEHRVLAVTSAIPKEGKSVTTLNLGCVLAEIRHLKILAVDGDFRRASLARLLNVAAQPGLAEVLRGEATYEEVLRPTPNPNLMLLPAGHTRGQSAAELLTAASLKPAFQRMQNDFHYTIVDTPPATTVTDVGIIGQMCHGVIVIIRLHRTAEVATRRAVRLLQVNNIPIVGCLIIGRDAPAGRYGYGYGYGYGYFRYRDHYDYYTKSEEEK